MSRVVWFVWFLWYAAPQINPVGTQTAQSGWNLTKGGNYGRKDPD
jgi:hypothetical protein